MNISLSKNPDSKQLDELWKAVGWNRRGKNKWKKILTKSSYVCSAWENNKLIGFGRILEDGIMCMFYDIGIHPDYQKKGVGTKIMKALIGKVKDKKYTSIGLFAWEKNPGNMIFYEKLGFRKTHTGMELFKYMGD